MPASLASTLYAAYVDGQVTALTFDHLSPHERAAWERVAEVAREQAPAPLFIAPMSVEAGEVITLEMRPPEVPPVLVIGDRLRVGDRTMTVTSVSIAFAEGDPWRLP